MNEADRFSRRLEVVNNGRLLEVSWDRVSDVISLEKKTLLNKLLLSYRSSAYDLPGLAALIGAYASLEDLEAKIKKAIMAGRNEQGEIAKV